MNPHDPGSRQAPLARLTRPDGCQWKPRRGRPESRLRSGLSRLSAGMHENWESPGQRYVGPSGSALKRRRGRCAARLAAELPKLKGKFNGTE